MQIGNQFFSFGRVQNVYCENEKKVSVKLKEYPDLFDFYGYQKEKALNLNIDTKIAITKSNNFNNILRLGTYRKIPLEDGSGEKYVWFSVVIKTYKKGILTSLGVFNNGSFYTLNTYCIIENAYKYKSKDVILLTCHSDNLPVQYKNNNKIYYKVRPNKIQKINF